MRVLITGGTGFVGLALAERLLADGYEVFLFGPTPPPSCLARALNGGRWQMLTGDIRAGEDVEGALATSGASHVIHAAAITPGADRERREARVIADVNVGGTINVVERAAAAGVTRLVVVSSVAVYGFAPPAVTGCYEEAASCPAPSALYGITKLAAEQAALRLGALHGLDTRVVRLGPLYGPWEHATGVRDALSPHTQVLCAARAGRAVILPRPMTADWIYSRDAAAGLAAVLCSPALHHSLYNLGAGATSDLVQWGDALTAAGLPVRWRIAGPGEASDIVYNLPQDRAPLSIERLTAETGFRPRFTVRSAATDWLAWVAAIETPPPEPDNQETP